MKEGNGWQDTVARDVAVHMSLRSVPSLSSLLSLARSLARARSLLVLFPNFPPPRLLACQRAFLLLPPRACSHGALAV